MQAIECITSPENQGVNAELTGNMPASAAGYEYPALAKDLPAGRCSTLFEESLDAAAPRTVTPYWSDISGAIQSTWHPTDASTTRHPAGLAAVHRGRAARKEAAVSTVTATAAANATKPTQAKRQRPGPRREPAGPAAGRARP